MAILTFLFLSVFGSGVLNAVPLTSDSETERDQLRIIGGEDAPDSYSPHMVALIYKSRVMCGGSIISRSLVLTAAHCVDQLVEDKLLLTSLQVRAGSNKWNSGGVLANVKDLHIHPQWNRQYIKYDAAILVLDEKLVLNDQVAEVQLGFYKVGENERSVVTGWGRTGPRIENDIVNLSPTPEDLQLLYVYTISYEDCQRQFNKVAEAYGVSVPPIDEEVEICTFYARGFGMCLGDSGSALIHESTRRQIGIASWGWNCADGVADVFVSVEGMRPFLETHLAFYSD